MHDRILTEKVRANILKMGMDLVGFGPVDRWKNAPYLLSPQAILPEAKTVVVGAIHITDTWTEMGGEPEPQDRSPGGWMHQNTLIDRISFRTSRILQDAGYKTIPVVSSNIWRYRQYEGIPSLFAPDLSHIHAAAAAGLAEIGWSGLAITPEFGPRVRFLSIVTEADLVPTPMYDGPPLCDRCGECIKHCPTGALRTDLNSTTPHVVEIGGNVYKYCDKNMWRCAWAEHFNLDLNSDTLKQKGLHVDEKVVVDEINSRGTRGHERGVCQKWCVPPHLRNDAPSFGRADKPITLNRINRRYPDTMPTLRKMRDDVVARAVELGFDLAAVAPLDVDSPAGKLAVSDAPGMRTVLAFAQRVPAEFNTAAQLPNRCTEAYHAAYMDRHHKLLVLQRMIEDYGYHATTYGGFRKEEGKYLEEFCAMTSLGNIGADGVFMTPEFGADQVLGAITTDAVLPESVAALLCDAGVPGERHCGEGRTGRPPAAHSTAATLPDTSLVTLFGIASAASLVPIADALRASIDASKLGDAVRDTNPVNSVHGEYMPKVFRDDITIRVPSDYVPGAKSVIVLGMHFPKELVENAGLETSQQMGCYNFHQFQAVYELRHAALAMANDLNARGHKTAIAENLLGIGSYTDSPRGLLPDFRSGALEAAAAGLGTIGRHGGLLTPEFGSHQRFICIVTDAELPANNTPPQKAAQCDNCTECAKLCPMQALPDATIPIPINGVNIAYPLISRNRCDWSKRYSLCSEEGPCFIGATSTVPAPEGDITIEQIAAACACKDHVMKTRSCILETCLRHCPA